MKSNQLFQSSDATTRKNLVKLLIRTKSLNEKLVLSKSALFRPKSRNAKELTQSYYKENILHQSKYQKNEIQVQTQPVEGQIQNLQKKQKEICYLKQTSQIFTQTELLESENHTNNDELKHNKLRDIKMTQSIMFERPENENENQNQGGQVKSDCKIQTCSSFGNSTFMKSQFCRTRTSQCDVNGLENELNCLRGEVQNLKSSIHSLQQQKNKWKKKAEKYSGKLKGVQKQMSRFATAYKGSS